MEEGSVSDLRPTEIAVSNKTQALIWKYFEKSSLTQAKCKICKAMLKTPSSTTTPLIRHLENKHKKEYKDYLEGQNVSKALKKEKANLKMPTPAKQRKINEHFKPADKWASNHPQAQFITKSIGKWMAQSFHPYSLVEESGFQTLMNAVEPRYSIPSRTTFSRSIIPDIFKDTKNRIKSEIKKNIDEVKSLAITTDLWTSASNDSFITITSHYIDSNFNIKTYCLGNSYFPEEHNAINIASKLKDMLDEWGLVELNKTVPIYCITDNAANMVSAVSLTPWVHLRCFAHTLQLALSDAKREIPGMLPMLSKARAIVGHYKHSCVAHDRLNRLQEQLGQPPLQLIQDCETRWNSEYHMLSRLIKLKQSISAELSTSPKPHNLTSIEWELAEGYVYILKPLDDATTISSSGFLPTLSAVLPLIDGIKTVIEKFITSGKKGIMFGRALFKAINLRFPPDQYQLNKHYLLAMVVDPRYKLLILDDATKRIATNLLEREIVTLEKEAKVSAAGPSSSCTSGEAKDVTSNKETEDFSLWQHLQSLSQKSHNTLSREEQARNEINAYFSLPTISMGENPCKWWEEKGHHYPLIAPVVKRYLGIPATEVPSERVFSSAGNIVNVRRRNLTQEHVSELVFLHHNL